MDMMTARIELPGGAYALVYRDVLRKTARLHQAELRRHMTPVDGEAKGKVLLSEVQADKPAPKTDYIVDFDAIDNDAINEMYILNQVKEWSLGPVTQESIDMMGKDQYARLVEEMDRLYKPSPL